MASLWKRDNSKYWVCCFTGSNGERLKRSTKQTQRSKALKVCLEFERAVFDSRSRRLTEAQARKVVSDISESAGLGPVDLVTSRSFLEEWLENKRTTKSDSTIRKYKAVVSGFLSSLGTSADLPISSISHSDVLSYRNSELKSGKAQSTVNWNVRTIRVAFKQALRRGLVLVNPADGIDSLPNRYQKRSTFTQEQLKLLYAAADKEWKGMILLGAIHGLRLGDAAAIKWGDIDWERRSFVIRPRKTQNLDSSHLEEMPMHADLVSYLDGIRKNEKTDDALFPVLSKIELGGASGLSEQFRQLMHRVGIYCEGEKKERKQGKGRRFFELSFHSMRHTAISQLANAGVSKEVRMKLSAHKSNVHERYTHHELDFLREQMSKSPSVFRHGQA